MKREKLNYIKYKKCYKLVDDFVVIDIETTGFFHEYHKIFQLGAIRFRNNEIVDKINLFINPDQKISSKISAITNVTNEMVADKPLIDNS